MRRSFMDYFNFLPAELTLDILSRLPAESVFDCKLVCTTWRSVVRHPSFYQMYLDHLLYPSDSVDAVDSGKLGFLAFTSDEKFYYVEYNNEVTTSIDQRITRVNFTSPFMLYTSFIGSCNGLICLAEDGCVCFCNPITREYVVLSEFSEDSEDSFRYCDFSFGYVSSTNEYKVVGILVYVSGDVEVHIYTLGSGNGWRNLGNFTSQFAAVDSLQGIFANGALYWQDRAYKMIITFDLAEEKFRENLSPLLPSGHNTMGVLDGFLYIPVVVDEGVRSESFDIWLLKQTSVNHWTKEGEAHDQSLDWSKDFRLLGNSELLAVTKSGCVLTYKDYYLNIYNKETSTSKSLAKFKYSLHQVSPHKNTLVSLKELGEENIKVMDSIEIEETKNHEQLQDDADPEYIYL